VSNIIDIYQKDTRLIQLGLAAILCFSFGIYLDKPILTILPFGIAFFAFFILFTKQFYFILLGSIPICIEWDLPGGISTDLPSEPLCVLMMGGCFYYMITNVQKIDFSFLKHKITLFLIAIFLWNIVTMINSTHLMVSLKYCLSKVWFISVYFLMTVLFIKNEMDLKKLFWYMMIPMTFVVYFALIKNYQLGFLFEDTNEASLPFFRNHVMYAATITIFYPFIYLAGRWHEKHTWAYKFLTFNKYIYVIAIYLSYTRACVLALIVAVGFYFVIKMKMVKWAVLAVVIGVLGFIGYMANENTYLKYAPEFTKTIYHDSYDNHLAATFEGHDASSMERVNMWIGALRAFPHYPIFGAGPGCFYPTYIPYTVIHYHTWVSDNQQHLSCHNYFFLTLIEQGIVGLLIFLSLTIYIFFYLEKKINNTEDDFKRSLYITLAMAFVMFYVNLCLSDLIETTKIGSMFFIFLALLVNAKYHYNAENKN
jgi:O-antigen ligase